MAQGASARLVSERGRFCGAVVDDRWQWAGCGIGDGVVGLLVPAVADAVEAGWAVAAVSGDSGGIDRDGKLDAAAKLTGQRVGDQGAQPGLQLLLYELIRRGDQRRVLYQPERPRELQPGPVRG